MLTALLRAGGCALAAALVLAGCSAKKDDRACPKVEVVGDLSRLIKFADGPGRDPADVAYVARITDVKSGCVYDKRGVTVDMIDQIIPLSALPGRSPTAANHTIIVGFQLTPEQIDYNQKAKRAN